MADIKMQKGFTLIELLVVSGIVILITGLVLANNNRFGGKVLLQNLAYDIALTIRQAQVYGIAVRGSGTAAGYDVAYGMNFDTVVSNKAYTLFADGNSNGTYEPTPLPGEIVGSPFAINRGYIIERMYVLPRNSTIEAPVTRLDIVFRRPNPDACISGSGVTSFSGTKCQYNYQRAKVVVASPRGDEMCIVIDATGQIAVENPQSGLPAGTNVCP